MRVCVSEDPPMAGADTRRNAVFMFQQLSELAAAAKALQGRQRTGYPGKRESLPETIADELAISTLSARRASGETYAAIAADLNRRGLRGRNGARWYSSSVWVMLNRVPARCGTK
jgi:hypothetical protein